MSYELWVVGKTKQRFVHEGIQYYMQRVKPFCQIDFVEIRESSQKKPIEQKRIEGQQVLKKLEAKDHLVLLDEKGEMCNSIAFSKRISKWQMLGKRRIVFLIGGAYGFDDVVYERANFSLALSSLTFTHDLARLVFMEQFYRAHTIIHNRNYHHE